MGVVQARIGINANITSGVAGTGSVGAVTITGIGNHTVTGVAGTGAVGATTYNFSYPVTGVSGTGGVGSVTVQGKACLLYTSPSPRD